ncbi:MAG: S-layer family protein, partial [Cyanobacteria bacterium J06642_3]
SEAFGSGNAGNVVINTKNLSIADQGQITLRSFDSGTPGNLIVNANSIELNSNAIITVENTASLEGGNIQLQIQDDLTLKGNSRISAQAFNNANGGNVDIDANFVIAPPQQNNDILASAVLGSGGNITISAEGIFGIEERNSRLSNLTNDIDASSEFGTSGIVTLFFPSFTAANGLFNLPSNFIDVIYLFNNSFCKISQDSSFTITGRGGMAYEPEDDLVAEQHWSDWRIVDEDPSAAATQPTEEVKPTPQARQIALVQGWIRDDQGNIVLTDKPVTVSPHKPGLNNPDCNQVKSTASNIEH